MACPECKSERCGTMNEAHSEADAWHQEALCQGRQATSAIADRAAYREALRALVAVAPACATCGAPGYDDGDYKRCERHSVHDYERQFAPLRAALALLNGPA